jgi:EmrB/QacA subfamily drug resistance transporter
LINLDEEKSMKRRGRTRPYAGGKYIIMVIVLTGVLMSVLDGIVVNIALPTITAAFRVDIGLSQWSITGYMVTLTALLLFFGRLSDATGKVPLFIVGFSIFTLASFACGMSRTLTELIAFRIIQAVGGAMVFSISGAILFLAFPPEERGRAMGYLGSTVAVGSILGPILGGFLVDTLGWQYIFLINVPIGVVLVTCALVLLRVHEERTPKLNMDWTGAVTLAASVFSLMLFLSMVGSMGGTFIASLLLAAVFAASTIAFILRERAAEKPLLDLRLFGNRAFLFPVAAMMLYFVSNFMINIVGPFYFQEVMGFRPTQVGLVFLIVPVVMVVASPASGWLYDRRRSGHYGTIGISLVAVSLFLLGLLARGAFSFAEMAGLFVLLALGSALFQSPNNTEIMNALPRAQTATASSVSAAGRNLAMTLGIAFASLLFPLILRLEGNQGTVMEAGRSLLAHGIGNVMILSALVCASAVPILARNGRLIREVAR